MATKSKTTKKAAKKPAKKTATPVKKTVKKPAKTAKPAKATKAKKEKAEFVKPKITSFKYSISGYGSELAWKVLSEKNFKYWRKVYDKAEEEYEAQRELIDHLRHEEGPQHGEPGYLGDYRNDFGDFEEYAFYSERSTLKLELFSGEKPVEEMEIPLTDKRIKKKFWDGFVEETKEKKKYTKGTVFAKTEDRGGYCMGEYELGEDEEFSLDNFEICVEKIQGFSYVEKLDYNDNFIDNDVYPDNYNKDFDAWIVWE